MKNSDKKQGIILTVAAAVTAAVSVFCFIKISIFWGIVSFAAALCFAVPAIIIIRISSYYLNKNNLLPLKVTDTAAGETLAENLYTGGYSPDANTAGLYYKKDKDTEFYFYKGSFAETCEILKKCKNSYGMHFDGEFAREMLRAFGFLPSDRTDLTEYRKEIRQRMQSFYDNPITLTDKRKIIFIFFDPGTTVRKIPYEEYIFPLPPVYTNAVCPLITFLSLSPDKKALRLASRADNFEKSARKEIKIIFKDILDF